MKIAYFDMFSGVSGDMILGALVDNGFPAERLEVIPHELGLKDVAIDVVSDKDHGITATQVKVTADESHHHRGLKAINAMIDGSKLPTEVKDLSRTIFLRLGHAEAAVHGVDLEEIHFHEVGALDSIVDIVGAAAGIAFLGIKRCYSSPFRFGTGFVEFSHGRLALPVPAVARLTLGYPAERTSVEAELTTPTGAAIITTLVDSDDVSITRPMTFKSVGYGMGTRRHEDRPNLLRMYVGTETSASSEDGDIVEMECNIDDMNPEYYDYLIDRLMKAGALDVYLVPVQMKKNRPGVCVHVLCAPRDLDELARLVLEHTSSIGLRYHTASRVTLPRRTRSVATPWGDLKVKEITLPGGGSRVKPEYDDLKKLALKTGYPLLELAQKVEAYLVGQ